MPSNNPPFDKPIADQVDAFGRGLADRASEAKESISDMARATAAKVDQNRSTAANRLDSAASAVHERAADLPGGEKVKQFAHGAAERMSTTADYMRSHDTARMMADVQSVVKNNPGPALLVAAAFGFLLGRSLTRD